MPNLEQGTAEWAGAIIVISEGGEQYFRPAAFVFDVPGGLAWVEPSYADPAGAASPAFHRRAGTFTAPNILRAGAMQIEVLQYLEVDADLVGDSLDWFAGWLKTEVRTLAQERERVRELLGDSLA